MDEHVNHFAPPPRVSRLGDFWKFLLTNLVTKVAQLFVDFLGYYEKTSLSK